MMAGCVQSQPAVNNTTPTNTTDIQVQCRMVFTGPTAGPQTLLVSHHDQGITLNVDNFLYTLTDPL